NDILLADDPRRIHAERLEDPLSENVTVELSSDAMNDHTEHQISGIAVIPFRSRSEVGRKSEDPLDELILGIVFAIIDVVAPVILQAGSMREQMADRNRLPRIGCARKDLL